MSIDSTDIILIIVCVIISILFTLFLNRHRLNFYCIKNNHQPVLYSYMQELKKNNIEDNIALVKKMEEPEIELL